MLKKHILSGFFVISAIVSGLLASSAIFISPVSLAAQTPAIGLYFEGKMENPHRLEAGEIFKTDLYITGANKYISAVEYKLYIQNSNIILVNVEYPPGMVLFLGDPLSGHSIDFSPPLSPSADTVLVCRLTFLPIIGCDEMEIDEHVSVVPHPGSGLLGATEWPAHEVFELTGLTSLFCPSYWPPELNDVAVYTPRCVKASFNQYVGSFPLPENYTDNFTLYTTAEPHDTIPVIEAVKTEMVDGIIGEKFFVYLESSMEEGLEYTLAAHACAEYNGCADSEINFTFEGGSEVRPDLAATFWIDVENGYATLTDIISDTCSPTEFNFILRNLGESPSGPFMTRIVAEPDYEGGPLVTVWEESYGGLAVDGTISGPVSVLIPNMPSYRNFLRIEVDYQGNVTELNEENNDIEAIYLNYKPEILSINDVPEDDGGKVELIFRGSFYDMQYSNGSYFIQRLDKSLNSWQSVLQFAAAGDSIYTCFPPTAIDSTGSGEDYWTVFRVNYYSYGDNICCPDSGYSVNDMQVVAVFLQSSKVEIRGSKVLVKWAVSGDSGCSCFNIYRSRPKGNYAMIARVPAEKGKTVFEYEDSSVEPGAAYIYRVEYENETGTHILFENRRAEIPGLRFSLDQNIPNPFNPSTKITFYIPSPSMTVLDIFDVSGRRVRRLVEGVRAEGEYSENWDGLDDKGNQVASGIYFYRLTGGKLKVTKKMVLLR